VTDENKLCRADGFQRFYADGVFEHAYRNWDFHHQGGTREPITTFFESTDSQGVRRLFNATASRLSLLDETTGSWNSYQTGLATPGTHFTAAELKDVVVFTNLANQPRYYDINSTASGIIVELNAYAQAARVVIQFAGFLIVMNTVEAGEKQLTRIRWSDLNLPQSWTINPTTSQAGRQDLPYGDEILAAGELLGSVYIFTRRAIWRMKVGSLSSDPLQPSATFSFERVYFEPKNQTGCLLYPNTLVSDGKNFWYMSRDTIYKYNPYIAAPERDEMETSDWIHRASGVIFRKSDTALDGSDCEGPVAEYRPTTHELFFSWPSKGSTLNNWTLVAQIEKKTADVRDHGFTALRNFRRTPTANLCNEAQDLLGASSRDWTIKSMGGVFFREFAVLKDPPDASVDLDLDGQGYVREGYNSILRGLIPTGLFDREKILRSVLIDTDVSEQDVPCVVRLRIGNSHHVVDANDLDDLCSPLWSEPEDRPLSCPDGAKISALKANGQRANDDVIWKVYEQARFLYFELTILNADGTPGIGGDACIERADFDLLALPKP